MQHAHSLTLNLSAMADSIIKQLKHAGYRFEEKGVRTLFDTAFSGRETTYELFKAANGRFHKRLIGLTPPIDIKRTSLLDILAKSCGFENHHSLKHAYERSAVSDLIDGKEAISFTGADQPLAKFFIHKKEIKAFLEGRGVTFGSFSYVGGQKEIRLMMNIGINDYIGSNLQKEINAYLKAYGLQTYKSFLVFPIAYTQEDPRPAMELIDKYENFFYPNWKIESRNLDSIMPGEIVPMEYEKARILTPDMFAIGNLACDMPWKTVFAVLDTMVHLDGYGDFEFETVVIQILLNVPSHNRKYILDGPGVPMSQIADIYDREEYLMHKKIIGKSAEEVVRRHKDAIHLFRTVDYILPHIEYIERHTGKSIGEIIRSLLDAAIETQIDKIKEGKNVRFDFDGSVDRRAIELCGISHKDLLDRDHDMWHHDMRKTIQYIISEVIEHFDHLQETIRSIRS